MTQGNFFLVMLGKFKSNLCALHDGDAAENYDVSLRLEKVMSDW